MKMCMSVSTDVINNVLDENIYDLKFGMVDGLLDSLYSEELSKLDVFFNFLNGDRFFEEDGQILFELSNKEIDEKSIIEEYFYKFVEKLITYDNLICNYRYKIDQREKIKKLGGYIDNTNTVEDITIFISKRDEVMVNFNNFLRFFNLNSHRYIERYKQILETEQLYFTMSHYNFKIEKYTKKAEEVKVSKEIEKEERKIYEKE